VRGSSPEQHHEVDGDAGTDQRRGAKLALRGGEPKAVKATVLAAPAVSPETETTNLSATRI